MDLVVDRSEIVKRAELQQRSEAAAYEVYESLGSGAISALSAISKSAIERGAGVRVYRVVYDYLIAMHEIGNGGASEL